jgi:hypothetical protein
VKCLGSHFFFALAHPQELKGLLSSSNSHEVSFCPTFMLPIAAMKMWNDWKSPAMEQEVKLYFSLYHDVSSKKGAKKHHR